MSLAVAWFAWLAPRIELELAWWLAVLFGVMLTWHSYAYDYLLALPLLCILWTRTRVSLASIWLAGGWLHVPLGEAMSWAVAPMALLLSVELWWRHLTQ